jgi:hypothetical protein
MQDHHFMGRGRSMERVGERERERKEIDSRSRNKGMKRGRRDR